MTGEVVVCRGVAKTFGSGKVAVVAVHGSDCVVKATDRVAINGPSGSGKSTLLHLMAGLESPTRGTVEWPGLDVAPNSGASAIGVVFQGASLIPTLNVAENVGLPLYLAGLTDQERRLRILTCLEVVDASGLAAKMPDELSGGQAQRVAVARVLAQQPRLILADEPTGQLDHATGGRVVSALLQASSDLDAALVITTHDPRVGEQMSTCWSMRDGRLSTSLALGSSR